MKRILAVFLTLAMALNIAPAAAFAAADSDAASIVAVEETDETSSPQLDEETARAIASDPFLQAAYAQTEQEQTGQAEVDTSNMSVSATNSFGQLLVNGLGMDGENGSDLSSESRVIEITMNGSTAMVKYIAKKDANLDNSSRCEANWYGCFWVVHGAGNGESARQRCNNRIRRIQKLHEPEQYQCSEWYTEH